MTNVVLLDSQAHRNLKVIGGPSAELGDSQRFVPVVIREFPSLAVHYPIFFSKDADTGVFYCGAMLGFDLNENLFLASGGTVDAYRPLNLQRFPFFVASDKIAIDLDNPRVSTTEGEALFDDNGAPTPFLESISAAFRELRLGADQTRAFIDAMMNQQLIEPIDIKLAFDDGSQRDIQGLYTISQDKLRALPDEAVLDFFRRGYLHLSSLMIASVRQVAVLAQRKNRLLLQGTEGLAGAPR